MRRWIWIAAIGVLAVVVWNLAQRRPGPVPVKLAQQGAVGPASAPLPRLPGASTAAADRPRPIGYGLSFALVSDPNLATDTAYLSCHGEPQPVDRPHKESCNPYQGDTSCRTVLPVLCAKSTGQEPPTNAPPVLYQAWMRGSLGATQPVMGAILESEASASALCEKELGPGWRMAEFVDGPQGWGLQGQRGLGLGGNNRYWVHAKGQSANCWNSTP